MPNASPEEMIFLKMLEQANNFKQCIELAHQTANSQKEQALKKALELSNDYDEALYVYMASNDPKLQKLAIKKAITLTKNFQNLEYWKNRAPTSELKTLAKKRLEELKKKTV